MKEEAKLRILIAWPYMSKDVIEFLKENQKNITFLLDSGAFTAWKAGKELKVEDYIAFIKSLPFKPWRYFNLDKIGDPEGSHENYVKMLKAGLKPLPVFTRGESPEMLEEYYKTSDVVGIGGLVGTQGNKAFVKGIMEHVGDRKVHWLGFNSKEHLAHYKPYMCDSSSWAAAVRFASVKLYDKNGKWYQVGKQDFATKPPDHILKLIKSYGIDPKRLAQADQWKNSGRGDYALELLTCRSWAKYQIDIMDKLGVNFFLACASKWQVRLMLESWAYWNEVNKKKKLK